VAFPPNVVFGSNILGVQGSFERCDLYQLFGSIEETINELQHRFDGLPIHSLVYYLPYHQGVLQNLMDAIKLDPTGNQQDCLGMTPLHILTCSSVHDLEMCRLIVQEYPTNLITEDRWGALPLLYAFWGAAPDEIIQFLLESYTSLYPRYVFNWTMMVETMGRTDTPKENIENLLSVKQMHYPEQPIDWEYLLDKFTQPSQFSFQSPFKERMQFLFMWGMSTGVQALAFQVWRDHIIDMIHTANFQCNGNNNQNILGIIQAKVAQFEDDLPKLKEATSILELAIWKMKINEKSHQDMATQSQKKVKTDESSIRRQSRITCGADCIIRHVLPFVISV
jgi:hypothetical protein